MYRSLTVGEVEMASLIFQDAIDYSKVRIYNRHLLALPHNNTVIMLWGYIFFPRVPYEEDFSLAPAHKQRWFIHEMAHVWQYQLGYPVFIVGAALVLKGGYRQAKKGRRNAYYLDPNFHANRTQLAQFNMEQQADLISFYYAIRYLGDIKHHHWRKFIETILIDFLLQPKQKTLLPKTIQF